MFFYLGTYYTVFSQTERVAPLRVSAFFSQKFNIIFHPFWQVTTPDLQVKYIHFVETEP